MKRILLTLLTLVGLLGAYAQKVIEKPVFHYSTVQNLQITKIQLTDTSTIVDFNYKGWPGQKIWIPKESFISDVNNPERIFPISAVGVELNKGKEVPESKELNYTLIYPKIGADVKAIDFGEGNDGGNWFIYDIQLQKSEVSSLIPESLQGEWYNKIGGKLHACIYAKEAFYKGKRWTYGEVSIDKKGTGFIELKNDAGDIKLLVNKKKGKAKYTFNDKYTLEDYREESKSELPVTSRTSITNLKYTRDGKGEWMIGESVPEMIPLCKTKKEVLLWEITKDDMPVKELEFSTDSAVYSGCISGYKDRYGKVVMTFYVNNILTGSQDEFSAKVGKDGVFSVKLPMLHGNTVFVRSDVWNGGVYLEPGKQVFQVLGKGEPKYLGQLGKVNNELSTMRSLNSHTYQEVLKKVLDMSVKDFVDFHQSYLEKDIKNLDAFVKANNITPKAEQIKRYELIYLHNSNKFEYKWRYEAAYRKKHNIPRKQRDLGVEIPKYSKEDISFLNNDLVNDSLAVIGGHYSSLINRIKYFSFFGMLHYRYGDVYNIAEGTQKYGYELTKEEEALIDSLAPYKDVFNEVNAFMASDANTRFVRKFNKELRSIYSKTKGKHKPEELVQLLKDEGAELDEVDEGFCQDKLTLFNRADVKAANEYRKNYAEQIKVFSEKYKDLDNRLHVDAKIEFRNKNLKENVGVEPGFAANIMTSQDILRKVVNEYEPIEEDDMGYRLAHISNPFIQQYIKDSNQQIIAKIEENKAKGGSGQLEMPEVDDNSKLFDALMAKYKGKVVYVDFWATWCSPCRSGIKKIAPLKAQMSDEDVVFVYISAASSPQGAYMNMLPEISGEHYKCTQEQWDALCKQFEVSGIPHYVLVDKNGKVAKNNFRLHNNQAIKQLINKYL